MTATLVAKNLAAGHGDRSLFAGLDLVVAPGDVIGLVGVNGAGQVHPAAAARRARPPRAGRAAAVPARRATVGHLPQEPERRPGETVRDFLARRTGVAAAQAAHGRGDPGAGRRRTGRRRRVRRRAWSAGSTSAAPTSTSGPRRSPHSLGLTVGLDQPMTALSGGQAARAGLASLLLSRYDVFLLDEPTNDLDLDGLERLETLRQRPARRHGRRQPRPRVPHPHGHQGPRTRPGPAADHPLRRRLRRPTWRSARSPAGTPARSTRSTPTRRSALEGRAQMQRSWMDKGVQERPPQGDRQRQDRPQVPQRGQREAGRQGPPDRSA